MQRALIVGASGGRGTGDSYSQIYPLIARCQLHLAMDETEAALASAANAKVMVEQTPMNLEKGAAYRALGQAYEAKGNSEEAEDAYLCSLEILKKIQSLPEWGQSSLAYGRFLMSRDIAKSKHHLAGALPLVISNRPLS